MEAFIFDFNEDIYGTKIKIYLKKFIRKEEKMIIKRAENLYKQKLKNPLYLKDTVNFILLEEKSKKYINNYKNY